MRLRFTQDYQGQWTGPHFYRAGQVAALMLLGFVGWQRVASGGHFLSDVVLSMLLITLIAAVLARLMPNPATASR